MIRTPRYVSFLIALADNTAMCEADRDCIWIESSWAALPAVSVGAPGRDGPRARDGFDCAGDRPILGVRGGT